MASSARCWSARRDQHPPRTAGRCARRSGRSMRRSGGRSYAGILPDAYLAALSAHAAGGVLPARDPGPARGACGVRRGGGRGGGALGGPVAGAAVVGFASGGRARRPGIADGEVETLYLLEDWRERGAGRRLMRAMGAHLRVSGLPVGHAVGAARQSDALVLPAPGRARGGARGHPRRRPGGRADRPSCGTRSRRCWRRRRRRRSG